MQRMSSKHMPITRERMNFLMEGVMFSVKSQKISLMLDQLMMGLMHPLLWWAHFAKVCFTINQSTLLVQQAHIGMKIG